MLAFCHWFQGWRFRYQARACALTAITDTVIILNLVGETDEPSLCHLHLTLGNGHASRIDGETQSMRVLAVHFRGAEGGSGSRAVSSQALIAQALDASPPRTRPFEYGVKGRLSRRGR